MATNWEAGFVVRTVASPAQGGVAIPSSALLVGDGLSLADGGARQRTGTRAMCRHF